jgi:hypothetical protein
LDPDSQIRYEKRDIKAGPVVWAVVAICAVTVAAALVLIPFMGLLEWRSAQSDPPPSPMSSGSAALQPPEPRLQEQPFADIEALRAEQTQLLSSYGWVDPEAGIVRIPVDHAMRLVAERGVPSRRPPAVQGGAQ